MPIGETPVDGGCNLQAAQPKASGCARWTRVRGRSPRASGPSATVSATRARRGWESEMARRVRGKGAPRSVDSCVGRGRAAWGRVALH